jgi:signal transduction histidine kinase
MGDQATDEQKEFARFILSGVRRMEQLIKDLLSYSRTVHASDETASAQANLDEALQQALTAVDNRVAVSWREVPSRCILFRCWKDRIPYDEAVYQSALAARRPNQQATAAVVELQ